MLIPRLALNYFGKTRELFVYSPQLPEISCCWVQRDLLDILIFLEMWKFWTKRFLQASWIWSCFPFSLLEISSSHVILFSINFTLHGTSSRLPQACCEYTQGQKFCAIWMQKFVILLEIWKLWIRLMYQQIKYLFLLPNPFLKFYPFTQLWFP